MRQKAKKVVGVWDDHDFGVNNGNKNFEDKHLHQEMFLDFMDEPLGSPLRRREGVYSSYYVDGAQQIKVILLDCRTFNTPYFGNPQSHRDQFGEEQWKWLDNELATSSQALFTFIGFGIQFSVDEERILPEFIHKESKLQMMSLLIKHKRSGVIFLSGDVHMAEAFQVPCSSEALGYSIPEYTSSGITHSGEPVFFKEDFRKFAIPDTFNNVDFLGTSIIFSKGVEDRYVANNVGLIEVKMSPGKPEESVVLISVIGEDNQTHLTREINFTRLVYQENQGDYEVCMGSFGPWYQRAIGNAYHKLFKKGLFFGYLVFVGNFGLVLGALIFSWKQAWSVFRMLLKTAKAILKV